MSLPVILRAQAESDIQNIYDEMELAQEGLGIRFVGRVRELLKRIESMPTLYGLIWEDVRAARIKKFRHLVYYVVFDDHVEVLAVMHGSRDATAWKARV